MTDTAPETTAEPDPGLDADGYAVPAEHEGDTIDQHAAEAATELQNPYLVCTECGGLVTATFRGANVPCGHAGYQSLCPTWGPLGCRCEEDLGTVDHGAPPGEAG